MGRDYERTAALRLLPTAAGRLALSTLKRSMSESRIQHAPARVFAGAPLGVASIAIGLCVLGGLHGLASLHLNPLTALVWAVVGVVAALVALRRAGDEARVFAAVLGLGVSLVATFAASLVLFTVASCGRACF